MRGIFLFLLIFITSLSQASATERSLANRLKDLERAVNFVTKDLERRLGITIEGTPKVRFKHCESHFGTESCAASFASHGKHADTIALDNRFIECDLRPVFQPKRRKEALADTPCGWRNIASLLAHEIGHRWTYLRMSETTKHEWLEDDVLIFTRPFTVGLQIVKEGTAEFFESLVRKDVYPSWEPEEFTTLFFEPETRYRPIAFRPLLYRGGAQTIVAPALKLDPELALECFATMALKVAIIDGRIDTESLFLYQKQTVECVHDRKLSQARSRTM